MISLDVLNKVRAAARSISLSHVPLNWWTELSTWQDFIALLRTGNRLPIHNVAENCVVHLVIFLFVPMNFCQ